MHSRTPILLLASLAASLAAHAEGTASEAQESCFEVSSEAGTLRNLNCLNAALAKQAAEQHERVQATGSTSAELANVPPAALNLATPAAAENRAFARAARPIRNLSAGPTHALPGAPTGK